MKKLFVLFPAILLFSSQAFSQTADQKEIQKVCLAETQAYTNLDYNSWASYHVQSPDELLAWNNPDGSFGSTAGWEKISKEMKEYFNSSKKENVKLTSDHFTFVTNGNMAFASFARTSQNAEGKTTRIQEYRTLLKKNGQWKILAVQAYIDYPSGK
jgi:hypothetical protein